MIKVANDTHTNPDSTGGCWPTRHQEMLLTAALASSAAARAAWLAWNQEIDLVEDTIDQGSYRLLPLIYTNLQGYGDELPQMGRLRGLHRRTWVETQLHLRAGAQIIDVLQRAGIRTLLLKGAALALAHYPNLGARPMNDLDLLVPQDQIAQAVVELKKAGWRPEKGMLPTPARMHMRHSLGFEHPAPAYLDLHWRMLSTSLDPRLEETVWAQAQPAQINTVDTLLPDPTELLLHVCVHGAAWSSTPPVRWVADAAAILRNPQVAIDWARLEQLAEFGWCALQLHATLGYLQRTQELAIPQATLDALARHPVHAAARRFFVAGTRRSRGLGQLPLLWHKHKLYLAQLRVQQPPDSAHTPTGFADYLQTTLGVESMGALVQWFVTRAAKRLRLQWQQRTRA